MQAMEVGCQYGKSGVINARDEGDSTSARPAREEKPGGGHGWQTLAPVRGIAQYRIDGIGGPRNA